MEAVADAKIYLESLLSAKPLLILPESTELIRFTMASITARSARTEFTSLENHHALLRPGHAAVFCN